MNLDLLKSKTVWAGILYAASKAMLLVPVLAPFAPVVEALAAALGAVGIKSAINKVKDVPPVTPAGID